MRESYRVPDGEPEPGRYVRNETGDVFSPRVTLSASTSLSTGFVEGGARS